MREAVIVAASRTAVGKSTKGSTCDQRSDEMAATVIRDLLQQTEGKLKPEQIEDVLLGCAMPESSQGLNMARAIALRAGLPVEVPAQTVNRFCSSGVQTIATASERIISGGAEVVLAGGVESMSLVPMTGFRISPNPYLMANLPELYMNMGLTAECVAEEFEISRLAQDEFALRSQLRAAAAKQAGKFHEEIVPVLFEQVAPGENGSQTRTEKVFDTDEHLRPNMTLEVLSKLRPVFKEGGTVTAGNSSPLSDGAAAVIVMERETAEGMGLIPLLRFVSFGVAGVAPELMGIGPIRAVPKALACARLSLDDIDLIELNEAFAAQAVAVIRELGIPDEKVNVNGGGIALGHPLGCTGAKLTVHLLHEMRRRKVRYGMVTMCIAGGQGAAGIFERLN